MRIFSHQKITLRLGFYIGCLIVFVVVVRDQFVLDLGSYSGVGVGVSVDIVASSSKEGQIYQDEMQREDTTAPTSAPAPAPATTVAPVRTSLAVVDPSNSETVESSLLLEPSGRVVNNWTLYKNLPFPPPSRNHHHHDQNQYTGSLSPYKPDLDSNRIVIRPQPMDAAQQQQQQQQQNNTSTHYPYLGMMEDSSGTIGYVQDVKLHLQPQHIRNFTVDISGNGDGGGASGSGSVDFCNAPHTLNGNVHYHVLQQHLRLLPSPPPTIPSRILCAIYTHEGNVNQTEAIRQTWGRRCDGLLFASTYTDAINNTTTSSSSSTSTLHVRLRHKSKREGQYRGLWQRTRSLISYLYQHHLEEYDYFHICGDDTFVIMENLRAYVSSDDVTALTRKNLPFLGGFWSYIRPKKNPSPLEGRFENFYYMGGGAGYTLNQRALQFYVEDGPLENCPANTLDNAAEDYWLSWCFWYFNVTGHDTRDASGAHRYHVLSDTQHALFPAVKYGMSSNLVRHALKFMQATHGFPLRYGPDYMSKESVAFHKYNSPTKMKNMEYWLYGTGRELCEGNQTK